MTLIQHHTWTICSSGSKKLNNVFQNSHTATCKKRAHTSQQCKQGQMYSPAAKHGLHCTTTRGHLLGMYLCELVVRSSAEVNNHHHQIRPHQSHHLRSHHHHCSPPVHIITLHLSSLLLSTICNTCSADRHDQPQHMNETSRPSMGS